MLNVSISPQLNTYLLLLVTFLLVIISVKLIFSKNLLENTINLSAFSLLIGLSYLLMDAPDVAMTEVALGACFSTCIYLSFLTLLGSLGKTSLKQTRIISSLIICTAFIVILSYVGIDLPLYGAEDSSLQTHISQYYIDHTAQDIAVPSFVAAILASYRGYDTLGETAVILIAGISVLLMFSQKINEDA